MAHAVNYQQNIDPALEVITVAASASTAQGDFVIEGPWFGVALNEAGSTESLSIDITAHKRCVGYSTVAVAATVGAPIYLNPSTGVYAAATATGNALVGYATKIKDSNNYFEFEKVTYATVA